MPSQAKPPDPPGPPGRPRQSFFLTERKWVQPIQAILTFYLRYSHYGWYLQQTSRSNRQCSWAFFFFYWNDKIKNKLLSFFFGIGFLLIVGDFGNFFVEFGRVLERFDIYSSFQVSPTPPKLLQIVYYLLLYNIYWNNNIYLDSSIGHLGSESTFENV